jgi:7,8-dihydroneopterin aldolase/epimerase/oxygenase
MSKITIVDLEVSYNVGVSDEERAQPQRLLISVEMEFDFSSAAMSDRLTKTIDYHVVAQRLLAYGKDRSWKLLEKLVTEVADLVANEFHPQSVFVEIKKFTVPQARYVSVSLSRGAGTGGMFKRAGWGIP